MFQATSPIRINGLKYVKCPECSFASETSIKIKFSFMKKLGCFKLPSTMIRIMNMNSLNFRSMWTPTQGNWYETGPRYVILWNSSYI
jgi:hypothetical protein